MAIRLVRESSDTPNITNKDDVISIRYSYGGYNGIVKGFGNECSYTSDNGVFKILDGRIVLDGWEIEVDSIGWSIDLSNETGTQYHSIFVTVNVSIETSDIQSTFLTGSYPEIDKGDDLTNVQNGTARLLLYNVRVDNGVISEVVKRFNIIPYLTQKVLDTETSLSTFQQSVKERLERLGFKQGICTPLYLGEGFLNKDKIYRQGNYVLLSLEIKDTNVQVSSTNVYVSFKVPKQFIPAESSSTNIEMFGSVTEHPVYGGKFFSNIPCCVYELWTDSDSEFHMMGGTVDIVLNDHLDAFGENVEAGTVYCYMTKGYLDYIKDVFITLGYEANPIE